MSEKYMVVCEGDACVENGKITTYETYEKAREWAVWFGDKNQDGYRYWVEYYDETCEPAYIAEQLAIEGGPHLLTVADIRNIIFGLSANINSLRDHMEANGVENEDTDATFKSIFATLKELCQEENT